MSTKFGVLAALWSTLAFGQAFDAVPDGFGTGRPDAPYGTYASPVRSSARPMQDRLTALERKIFGLGALNDKPVEQAEHVYLLEQELVRFQLDLANAAPSKLTAFEREAMLEAAVRAYRNLRTTAERLFEDMVRYIDVQLPGPNGGQFRVSGARPEDTLYLPNFRVDERLPKAERAEAYEAKVKEFLAKGGSLSEMKELTPATLHQLGAVTWLEYVVRENGEIWVTTGKAGHILLGQGKPVQAAGQILILKDRSGHVISAVLTNASGSYKPDILSVERFGERLAPMLGIPERRLVVTKGEPLSTQAVKIYMKGAGQSAGDIKTKIAAIEEKARLIREAPTTGPTAASRCSTDLLSLVGVAP